MAFLNSQRCFRVSGGFQDVSNVSGVERIFRGVSGGLKKCHGVLEV